MIADSLHGIQDFPLTPRAGIVAGLSGSLVMLGAVAVLDGSVDGTVGLWLRGLARVVGALGDRSMAWGLALHLAFGALLGLLYAVSQQRIAAWALIGVGLFYGVFLWVAGRILLGWLVHTDVREVVRTWTWLMACLIYGLWLALSAAVTGSRRRASPVVVPQD